MPRKHDPVREKIQSLREEQKNLRRLLQANKRDLRQVQKEKERADRTDRRQRKD